MTSQRHLFLNRYEAKLLIKCPFFSKNDFKTKAYLFDILYITRNKNKIALPDSVQVFTAKRFLNEWMAFYSVFIRDVYPENLIKVKGTPWFNHNPKLNETNYLKKKNVYCNNKDLIESSGRGRFKRIIFSSYINVWSLCVQNNRCSVRRYYIFMYFI